MGDWGSVDLLIWGFGDWEVGGSLGPLYKYVLHDFFQLLLINIYQSKISNCMVLSKTIESKAYIAAVNRHFQSHSCFLLHYVTLKEIRQVSPVGSGTPNASPPLIQKHIPQLTQVTPCQPCKLGYIETFIKDTVEQSLAKLVGLLITDCVLLLMLCHTQTNHTGFSKLYWRFVWKLNIYLPQNIGKTNT